MIESFHPSNEERMVTANKRFNRLGLCLIFISSVLLGIWATKDTIALRNILLVLGALLSLVYIALEFRLHHLASQLTLKTCVPLILIGLMFVWIVVHYIFLGRYPEMQFDELKSTWLRSFLAVILALGTGLAIKRSPKFINLLWLGILASFLILFYQYIPIAIKNKNLFAPDWYGPSYIYYAKINGVLMGTLLIAGLTGTLIDNTHKGTLKTILFISVYWFLGVFFTIYSYVYIFMARNGIGLAVLLLIGWFIIGIAIYVKNKQKKQIVHIPKHFIISTILAIFLFVWFSNEHIKTHPSWLNLFQDINVAIQIEKYQNWKAPHINGLPMNKSGSTVDGSVYVRVAWAVAGLTLLMPENPLGLGILNRPFPNLIKQMYGVELPVEISSTHSAWIEFGLAFGYPGIFLLLSVLAIIIVGSVRKQFMFRATCLSISVSLLLIYTVGELSAAHAVEIFFYWITFLFVLQAKSTINK